MEEDEQASLQYGKMATECVCLTAAVMLYVCLYGCTCPQWYAVGVVLATKPANDSQSASASSSGSKGTTVWSASIPLSPSARAAIQCRACIIPDLDRIDCATTVLERPDSLSHLTAIYLSQPERTACEWQRRSSTSSRGLRVLDASERLSCNPHPLPPNPLPSKHTHSAANHVLLAVTCTTDKKVERCTKSWSFIPYKPELNGYGDVMCDA